MDKFNLSDRQKELLRQAHGCIRAAQEECENVQHGFYSACDDSMHQILDMLDEYES